MLPLGFIASTGLAARPITGPWPQAFPAKELCSNCGLCRSSVGVASVTEACAFIGDGMSRAESLEAQLHGRERRYDDDNLDEAHFGVHDEILLARGFQQGAQWTGVATGVALAWSYAEATTTTTTGADVQNRDPPKNSHAAPHPRPPFLGD